MKTIFLVLALVYVAQADPPVVSVVASDEELVPLAVPGGVNFLPPPYDDVMGKMCKIRADCFEVSRILAVYKQNTAGRLMDWGNTFIAPPPISVNLWSGNDSSFSPERNGTKNNITDSCTPCRKDFLREPPKTVILSKTNAIHDVVGSLIDDDAEEVKAILAPSPDPIKKWILSKSSRSSQKFGHNESAVTKTTSSSSEWNQSIISYQPKTNVTRLSPILNSNNHFMNSGNTFIAAPHISINLFSGNDSFSPPGRNGTRNNDSHNNFLNESLKTFISSKPYVQHAAVRSLIDNDDEKFKTISVPSPTPTTRTLKLSLPPKSAQKFGLESTVTKTTRSSSEWNQNIISNLPETYSTLSPTLMIGNPPVIRAAVRSLINDDDEY